MRARPAICLVFVLTTLLAGCDQALPSRTERDDPTKAPLDQDMSPTASNQVLVEAGLDIVPIVSTADQAWAGKPVFDRSRYDQDIDVTRRTAIFPAGMVVVDRESHGGVVYVRLQSGVGERCGEGKSLSAAYAKLSQYIAVPELTPRDVDHLKRAWSKDEAPVSFSNSGVTVRAAGGCLPWLSIKAG